MTSRRKFIADSCRGCLGLLGLSFIAQSCSTSSNVFKTTATNHVIFVPDTAFNSGLQNVKIRVPEMEFDILLMKEEVDYKALYLKCTHEPFGLVQTNNKLVCTAHGSSFDMQGNVLQEPASRPLKKFKTEKIPNGINIYLR